MPSSALVEGESRSLEEGLGTKDAESSSSTLAARLSPLDAQAEGGGGFARLLRWPRGV